jgi:beta-galactosidase
MIALCHEADPTRLVTTGNDNIAADNNRATEEYLAAYVNDIVGYNYPDRWHERRELLYSVDKAEHPDRRMVSTETGGLGSRRGYLTPAQLVDVEQRWKYTLLHDYVIGDFMWTGIDYYGETSWPSRGAASGYLDNCGFKKDGYYFFKSIWTNDPVVHLASDWNRDGQEGEIVPVICFTNCNEVELFVNGKSYGTKTFEFPRTGTSGSWNTYAPGKVFTSTADLHLQWDVEYHPGEILAVGKKDGKEYTHRIVTTDKPYAIRLSVDCDKIRAVPSDVAHVTAEVIDKDGHVVPYAENPVKFEIEGAATLAGIESGNFADLSSTKASQRKAFRGKCLAIIQASRPGAVCVKATADGLAGSEIRFSAVR